MLSLLRKDFDWWIVFTTLGTIFISGFLIEYRFVEVWIVPDGDIIEDLLLTWGILAVVAGLVASFRDELGGTRDYARHRPVSRARLFWVKNFWSFVMMAIWLVVPLVVVTIWPLRFPENRVLADYGRFWHYAALSTFMLPSYATGYFTGTARGAVWLRFVQGGLIGYPLVFLTDNAIHSWHPVSHWTFAGGQLLFAAVVITAASMNENHARDKDRPTPTLACGANLLAIIPGLVIALGLALGSAQTELLFELNQVWPRVGKFKDGSYHLVKAERPRTLDELEQVYLVGNDHEKTSLAENLVDHKGAFLTQGSSVTLAKQLNIEGGLGKHWIRMPSSSTRAFLDRTQGEVYEFALKHFLRPPSFKPAIMKSRRPDGTPFENARAIPNRMREGQILVVYEMGTPGRIYWKRSGKPGNFRLGVLPDGEFISSMESRRLPHDDLGVEHGYETIAYSRSGKQYRMVGDDFELIRLTPEQKARGKSQFRPYWGAYAKSADPFKSEVVVYEQEHGSHKVVRRFHIEPRTSREKAYALSISALSFLKPAMLNVLNYQMDIGNFYDSRIFTNHGVFGGRKRAGILTSCVVFSLLAGVFLRRRIRRIGASDAVANFWGLAAVVGGPVVIVLAIALERPRAYAEVKLVAPEDARPCLLKSVPNGLQS